MNFLDGGANRFVLRALVFVNNVRVVDALDRHVRRNHHHRQLVNLQKFVFLSLSGARHSGKFLVHAKIILESYRRQSLRFAANPHAFLSFDSLMKTVGIAAPSHEPAGKFVDNNNFVVAHNVIAVAFHESFGAERGGKAVAQLNIFRRVQIRNSEPLFDFRNDFIFRRNGFLLFVDGIIFALAQIRYGARHDRVHFG